MAKLKYCCRTCESYNTNICYCERDNWHSLPDEIACAAYERRKPRCFTGNNNKCNGFSKWNDDEPILKCQKCSYFTSFGIE